MASPVNDVYSVGSGQKVNAGRKGPRLGALAVAQARAAAALAGAVSSGGSSQYPAGVDALATFPPGTGDISALAAAINITAAPTNTWIDTGIKPGNTWAVRSMVVGARDATIDQLGDQTTGEAQANLTTPATDTLLNSNGWAYFPTAKQFYFSGGGHGGWPGNEVYGVDLTRRRFFRQTDPSPMVRNADGTWSMLDGTPISTHTYGAIAAVESLGAFFVLIGSPWPLGNYLADLWKFDVNAGTWTKLLDMPLGRRDLPHCLWVQSIGKLVLGCPQWFRTYDPVTGTLGPNSAPLVGTRGVGMTVANDTGIYSFFNDAIDYVPFSGIGTVKPVNQLPNYPQFTSYFDWAAVSNKWNSVLWDPARSMFIVWDGSAPVSGAGSRMWAIDMVNGKLYGFTLSGAAPVGEGLGAFTKFTYISEWDAYMAVNNKLVNNGIMVIKPGSMNLLAQPAQSTVTLKSRVIDEAKVVHFDAWHISSRYERYQRLTVLTGSSATIAFHGTDFAAGGALRSLAASSYTLLVDGVAKATSNAKTGTSPAGYASSFTLSLTGLSEGWHEFDIVCDPTECCPPFYFYVKKASGPVPAQTVVPVTTGSYDIEHIFMQKHYWGLVPAGLTPTAKPIVARECPPFSTALARANLFRENIVPQRDGNINRTVVNPDGVQCTFNKQAYFFSDLVDKYPKLSLVDGPRGVGSIMMPTHIQVDRHGGAYCSDPWRVVRVSPEGTVTTRCGWRHNPVPASQWETNSNLTMELVGDWSAIPVERHGFHEVWGLAFDFDSLALDPNGVPQGGEQPHLIGPRLFVSDSQNNRVCLLTFQKDSFTAEPVVTEFLTGLNDPWDVLWDSNARDGKVIYVSERKDHRIAAYNALTGAFIRVVVSGAALGFIDSSRVPRASADLSTIQAEDVVLPEGLFIQDGWLYFGSAVMEQVKRINLTTDVIELVCSPYIDGNSRFMKIALSDGTFGPRGTVFASTWSVTNHGMPEAFLPGGTKWPFSTFARISRGKGGAWDSISYASACGIGLGRLLAGSADEGLVQISQALSGEVAGNATTFEAGNQQFLQAGHRLLHGFNGYGWHGLALPWGQSAEIDYYLTWNGHTPP